MSVRRRRQTGVRILHDFIVFENIIYIGHGSMHCTRNAYRHFNLAQDTPYNILSRSRDFARKIHADMQKHCKQAQQIESL